MLESKILDKLKQKKKKTEESLGVKQVLFF